MKAVGQYTQCLWEAIAPDYKSLLNHPFANQLASGELAISCFSHYLAQDVLYIKDDARALQFVSDRAVANSEKRFFNRLAKDGLQIEHILHDEYLSYFNAESTTHKSPVCKAYTLFLLNHAQNSSYEVAAAALLPCFWVYNKVGAYISSRSPKGNRYQKWIDTYGGVEYESFTQEFIQLVENLSAQASPAIQKEMLNAFVDGTQFEFQFFDEAIQLGSS